MKSWVMALPIVALPFAALAQAPAQPTAPLSPEQQEQAKIQQAAQDLQDAVSSLNKPAQQMIMTALTPYLQARGAYDQGLQKRIDDLQKQVDKDKPAAPQTRGPQSVPARR